MGSPSLIPKVQKDDWVNLNRVLRKLAFAILGLDSTPTFNGLNLTGPLDMNDNSITKVGYIDYDLDAAPATEPEGRTWWNVTDHTMNISSGLGPVNQSGQEIWTVARNETGSQIDDGQVVFISGAAEGRPLIIPAKADKPTTTDRVIGIATMDIPDNTEGIVTKMGTVRGIDTSSCAAGDQLYVSASEAGAFTNVQPVYPNYILKLGNCEVSDADVGKVAINVTGRIEDILENAWNGGFLESINFTVAAAGGVITGSLANNDDTKNLTMNFSTGFQILDATPAITVILTAGSDTVPQVNFVYVPVSTKVLVTSTSDWPAEEHIKVALVSVRSAATTQSDGALRNQNWNDHVASSDTSMGHVKHISERLRQENAKWSSGAEGSVTINTVPTPNEVFMSTTAGKIYQLHRQGFPALDMEASDDIHIVNDSAAAYKTVTDLGGETLDALGNTLANASFSFVLWGIANRTDTQSHLMLNLPTGVYAKNQPDDAVSDPSNFSVYDIPAQFRGVGFLIARFTFVLQAGGNDWSLHSTQNLRGFTPNVTAGGGAGGGGVSTFTGQTDTPSAYTDQALKIAQVNGGETALEFTSTPTITADNISDGGNNAIITTTQETNFESAFSHVSADGSSHADVALNTTHGSSAGSDHSDVVANTAKVSNATHTGEVTGSGALTIADNIIDEANLKLATGPTNDYVLTADSGETSGMKWAVGSSGGGFVDRGDPSVNDYVVGDLTTDNNWHVLDLFTDVGVPKGAKSVLIKVALVDNAVDSRIRFRKNGNVNSTNSMVVATQVANVAMFADATVALDADAKIEYLASNVTFTTINLLVRSWQL
jgi:hypothetical protein